MPSKITESSWVADKRAVRIVLWLFVTLAAGPSSLPDTSVHDGVFVNEIYGLTEGIAGNRLSTNREQQVFPPRIIALVVRIRK